MEEKYKLLYEDGPTRVGLVLVKTQTGSYRGDSKNLQLEWVLSGETDRNLVFDELCSIDCVNEYIQKIDALKSLVRKEYVATIYQIKD